MQSDKTNGSSVSPAQIDLFPDVADSWVHSGGSADRSVFDPASSALGSADCVDRAFVLGFWCSFLNSFPLSRRCCTPNITQK